MQGVWVQSLVRELRSHVPYGQKKPKHKTETMLQQIDKEFKSGPCPKKKKKKLDHLFQVKKTYKNLNTRRILFKVMGLGFPYAPFLLSLSLSLSLTHTPTCFIPIETSNI